MTGPVLDLVSRRADRADAVSKVDDTLTLAIAPEGDTRVAASRTRMTHLRVEHAGRIGYASRLDGGSDELADAALVAAGGGPALHLFLPMPAPIPELAIRSPQATAAHVPELEGLARALLERLRRGDRRVEVWSERSIGSVQVGNTRGVLTGYECTMAGAGAVVESIGAGYAPPCRVHTCGTSLPGLPDLEALVDEVDHRLDPPLVRPPRALPAAMPVCFAPRAVATLLRPLRIALTGHQMLLGDSPLRGRIGDDVFDAKLSVFDDPLAPARPGSRPIDDDGVVTRRVPLIERGRLVGCLVDLEVGARAGVPSTGHGWRAAGAGSRVGFTNLRVLPGVETRATLLTMMGRGLLVLDLDWSSGPNPVRGTLHLRAPWSYLVESGAVVGRLEGISLVGNLFDTLARILAVGGDGSWVGAVCTPSLLFESMTVVTANR